MQVNVIGFSSNLGDLRLRHSEHLFAIGSPLIISEHRCASYYYYDTSWSPCSANCKLRNQY